jgi:hypothetical protein
LLPKNSAQQHQHPASLLLLLLLLLQLLLHDDAHAAAADDDDADAYYYYTALISLQKTLLFLYPLPSSLAQKLLLQATSLESRIFPSLQTVTNNSPTTTKKIKTQNKLWTRHKVRKWVCAKCLYTHTQRR